MSTLTPGGPCDKRRLRASGPELQEVCRVPRRLAEDDRPPRPANPFTLSVTLVSPRSFHGLSGHGRHDHALRARFTGRALACERQGRGLVRAAIRSSAPDQPGSNSRPGSSRSITTGAWSDGVGGPLRASRSISDQTSRSMTGSVE